MKQFLFSYLKKLPRSTLYVGGLIFNEYLQYARLFFLLDFLLLQQLS